MMATAVLPNAKVTVDNHSSKTDGWASLTFTPETATGIRGGFSNPTGMPIPYIHYHIYAVQLYGPAN